MATSILGFSRVNGAVAVGSLPSRAATLSPYNYQDTPKKVVAAVAAGNGFTTVQVEIDGKIYHGGICVGRTVGPNRSAVPGSAAKINLFWVTPQAEPSDPRNTYVDRNGETVAYRTDWVPITSSEAAEIHAGGVAVVARTVTPKAAPVADPVVEATEQAESAPKGRKAKREAATA